MRSILRHVNIFRGLQLTHLRVDNRIISHRIPTQKEFLNAEYNDMTGAYEPKNDLRARPVV